MMGAKERMIAALHRLRSRISNNSQANGQGARTRPAAGFLSVSLAVGVLTVLMGLYTPCYAVQFGGMPAGFVTDQDMVLRTMAQVEGHVGKVLEEDYSLNLAVDYRLTVAPRVALLDQSALSDTIVEAAPEVKQAYVLTVDGVYVGMAEDKAAIDEALEALMAQYVTTGTIEAYFSSEPRVTRKYVDAMEPFQDKEALLSALVQTVRTEGVYEAKEGDTLASVAEAFEMTEGALVKKNLELEEEPILYPGQALQVDKTVPLLSVYTVEEYSYTQAVAPSVIEEADETMFIGESLVLEEGTEGAEVLEMRHLSFNGQRQTEEILTQTIVLEPTETRIAVGTRELESQELEPGESIGELIWPCNGTITSRYGYRFIFGSTSFHGGLDIANSLGTSIYAADGGEVIFVGVKGTYGNLVIVDHGNGMRTYYAHCSELLVEEGDRVSQGDLIALMGSTGRSTGSHLHFEVRIDGATQDPELHLPGGELHGTIKAELLAAEVEVQTQETTPAA